jgi:small subunit ribosomal protein S13
MTNFIFLSSTFNPNVTLSFLLRSFFGLGKHSISKITARYSLSPSYRVSIVPQVIMIELEKYVFANFRFGRSYQRNYLQTKNFKLRSGLYSGIRMSRGLPSRGQRSKTNASTSKHLNTKLSV